MENLPVFVKITSPKDVVFAMDTLKASIDQARMTLDRIDQLSHQETIKISDWKVLLSELEHSIDDTVNHLAEPEKY